MAAIQAAVGFAQVAKIQSTSKNSKSGGGSAAGSTGAGAAAGATARSGAGGEQAPRQAVAINLQGEVFGRDQVRGLLERINEEISDGARLVLT